MARRRLSPATSVFALVLLPLFVPIWVMFVQPPLDDPAAAQEKLEKRSELPVSKPRKAPMMAGTPAKKLPTPPLPGKTSELASKGSVSGANSKTSSVVATPPVEKRTASVARAESAKPRSVASASTPPAKKPNPRITPVEHRELPEPIVVADSDTTADEPEVTVEVPRSNRVVPAIATAEPFFESEESDELMTAADEDLETFPQVTQSPKKQSVPIEIDEPAEVTLEEPSMPSPFGRVIVQADDLPQAREEVAPRSSPPTTSLPDEEPELPVSKPNVSAPLAQKVPMFAPEPATRRPSSSAATNSRELARKNQLNKPAGKEILLAPPRSSQGVASTSPRKSLPPMAEPGKTIERSVARSTPPLMRPSTTPGRASVGSLAQSGTPRSGSAAAKVPSASELAEPAVPEAVAQRDVRQPTVEDTVPEPVVTAQSNVTQSPFKQLPEDMPEPPAPEPLTDEELAAQQALAKRLPVVSAEQPEDADDEMQTMRNEFAFKPQNGKPNDEASSPAMPQQDVVQLFFEDGEKDSAMDDEEMNVEVESPVTQSPVVVAAQPAVNEPQPHSESLKKIMASLVPVRSINVQKSVQLPPVAENDSPAVLQPADQARSVLSRRTPVTLAAAYWTPWQSQRDSYPFFHRPLYFEDANLERCGRGRGSMSTLVSMGLFYSTIPVLPYRMGAENPHHCVPTLPDCLTCERFGMDAYLPPWSWKGAFAQGAATAGLIWAVP